MQKLDPASAEKIPSSVNFFHSKPSLLGFQQSSNVEYSPISPLGNGPIHFQINTGQTYIDASKMYLATTFRVMKKEGNNLVKITDADPVSFIQGFGGSFIKNMKVAFNKRQVFNSNDLFSYNFYLRRRLGLEVPTDIEDLEAAGYYEDGLSQISGPGFEARRALFENGSTFQTICSLDADIFRQQKLLLNQMVIDIELTPHNNFFALLNNSDSEYQYQILECKLYARQHLLMPQMDLLIQESLNKDALAKYSYTRNIMKNFFIESGRFEFDASLFNDYLPKRVFAVLVDAKAFQGSMGLSPFVFGTNHLETITLITNGTQTPAYPYKLDWDKKKFGRAFKDLNDATKHEHRISIQKYLSHSAIFGFDLQSQHYENVVELEQIGATSISLKFAQPVPANGLQLIIYGEFNSILALDKTRTITTAMPV